MRGATMSLIQAWLIGIGAFTAVTAAFCLALTIAIAGPLSPSEIEGVQLASADALRDLDAAGQRVRGKLCAYLPAEQREAASCETDVAQTEQAPVTAPTPPPPPRVIVADVDTAPSNLAPPVEPSVSAAPQPPRRGARAIPAHRPPMTRRASGGHRARPPAHRGRHDVLVGAEHRASHRVRPQPAHPRQAPVIAANPPASTPHSLPNVETPTREAPALEPAAVNADDLRGGGHAHASAAEEILSEDEPPPEGEEPPPDEPPPDFEGGMKK